MVKIDYEYGFSTALISKIFKNAMLGYFLITLQIIQIFHVAIQTRVNQWKSVCGLINNAG